MFSFLFNPCTLSVPKTALLFSDYECENNLNVESGTGGSQDFVDCEERFCLFVSF